MNIKINISEKEFPLLFKLKKTELDLVAEKDF